MGIEPIKSEASSIEVGPGRVASDRRAIPTRGTYTPKNAEYFRELFDIMIRTQENRTVSSIISGLKPSTLYLKAQDALKWLAENHPNSDQYAILRSQVSIRRLTNPDGILIYFKPNIANAIKRASAELTGEKWDDEFKKWLLNAQPGDIFEKNNIYVTELQKTWIQSLSSDIPDSMVEVTSTSVRFMR